MSSLVDDAVSGLRTAAASRVSTATVVTLTALSLIVAQLGFRAWAVYGGWFTQDDLIFLSDVASGKADLTWLFHRHGVHFMPVGFALTWLVGSSSAYNWSAAATELIVMQAAASLSCWWMLRTLFGNRLRILPPLAFFLFATISLPALMWWAAGINILPVQVASCVAVTAHVLFLRTSRKRFAVLAAAAFGFGLLCYVKAILIPVVLGILALSYFANGSVVKRFLSVVRAYWFAWVLYVAIGATFLILYARSGPEDPPGKRASPDYAASSYDFFANSLGTSVLGGPWKWLGLPGMDPRLLTDAPKLGISASVLAIVLILIFGAARHHGALKPLFFVVPFALSSYLIIVTGRGEQFGSIATLEIRYWADFMPYAALAIGLFWMPLIGATDPLVARDQPLITANVPTWSYVAFGLVFMTGSIWSSVTYVKPWHETFQTRGFIENAQKEFEAREDPVPLANETVPEAILAPLMLPYNQAAHLFAPLEGKFTIPDIATDLETLDPFGSIVPGRIEGGFSVPASAWNSCVIGDAEATATEIDFGTTTIDFPFWMSITYRSNEAGTVTAITGGNWRHSTVKAGKHTLFFRTEGPLDKLTLIPSDGTRLCLDTVQIGPKIVPAS